MKHMNQITDNNLDQNIKSIEEDQEGIFKEQQTPKKKFFSKNNVIVLLILIIVFLLMLLLGAVLQQRRQMVEEFDHFDFEVDKVNEISDSLESNSIKLEEDLAENVKNIFKDFNELPVTKVDSGMLWWISDDGFSILNEDSIFTVSTGVDCTDFNYEEDLEKIKQMKSEFSSKIDELMFKEGYELNDNNSSSSYDDDSFYDYIRGYENDKTKCLLTISPECSGSGDGDMSYSARFSCTDNFDFNYQVQAPILNDLQLFNQVIRKEKETDEYLYLLVNARRSGYYVIAKKINGKWTEIIGGQDSPLCSDLKKHKVPESIWNEECWIINGENEELIKYGK